jgi:hypothetical protein
MGTINDVSWGDPNPYPNTVATIWTNAGEGKDGISKTGDYKFKVKLTSTDPVFTTTSDYSLNLKVDDNCMAKNPITLCETTITESQITQCETECIFAEPTPCPDADCDGVADCIDEITTTPANCEDVGECSGVAAGTSACIPAMDCTGLTWSGCKNCDGGLCTTDGGFASGTMYMERCEGMAAADCACQYIGGVAPPGCNDDPSMQPLNQWNNRFKECIEEQEFPVFDGFNVIAVLLILSMYYAVIIIRKRK